MKLADKLLAAGIVAALTAAVGLSLAARPSDSAAAAAPSAEAGDLVYGNPAAPATVLELASLTCPHCARWEEEQLPRLRAALLDGGKARLVVRDFPLDGPALLAAAYVRCLPAPARAAAHRELLLRHKEWEAAPDVLSAAAAVAGGRTDAVAACAADKSTQDAVVAAAQAAAAAWHVAGTPTFVAGGKVMLGASAEKIAEAVAGAR